MEVVWPPGIYSCPDYILDLDWLDAGYGEILNGNLTVIGRTKQPS